MHDIIIIGAGPAGISAALYAKRAGNDVAIIYSGDSNLEKAEKIDNYYGFVNGISGKELYENGIEQARNLGIEIINEEVVNIEKVSTFSVSTSNNKYECKALIVATGNKKLKPDIKGVDEFDGRGISYCAVCDGFFFRNKNVVVIGNGKYALHEAEYLKNIAASVKVLTNGLEMTESSDIDTNTKKIIEIKGDDLVNEVVFEDGTIENVNGVFIALGQAGGSDFAKKMGVLLNGDHIVVNDKMQTNIEGLYSCGDIVGGLLQVSKSVYDGAEAGMAASTYVRSLQ